MNIKTMDQFYQKLSEYGSCCPPTFSATSVNHRIH